jgi:ketosteroid isomerase-like protein
MKEKRMKRIIDEYIRAYNKFDVDGMIINIDEDIEFKNITNGEVNAQLNGKDIFKKQLEQSNALFKKREMNITEQVINGDTVENKIDFKGVFAVDVPNGPKSGELLKLKSKSVFTFKKGRIISIEDIN